MKYKKEVPIDRRIQKTKRALTEALICLILEKSYEKVTIQDIIDRANVGRSTFYMHYESKEQLLLDGHNNLQVRMFENIGTSDKLDFLNLFDHVAQNANLAKAMLGKKGGFIMVEFFKNNISLNVRKIYGSKFGRTKNEQRMLRYLSDASGSVVISLLVSWLEDEMILNTNEISEQCQRAVSGIFRDAYNISK